MPTADMKPITSEPDVRLQPSDVCLVCPHPWDEHDPIAIRYCTATADAGSNRGCACSHGGGMAYNTSLMRPDGRR